MKAAGRLGLEDRELTMEHASAASLIQGSLLALCRRLTRLQETPRELNVYIVPSSELPGGVGEPGVLPVAPALCNAIFGATGRRIRNLPVGKQLPGGVARAGGAPTTVLDQPRGSS